MGSQETNAGKQLTDSIAKLVIRSSGGQRFEFPLIADVVTIGRGRDCDLVLDDDFASRSHARIEKDTERLVLVDNDSRNGVLVNGKRMKGRHVLAVNDQIEIGDTHLTFVVHRTDETTTRAMPPLSKSQVSSQIQVDSEAWEVWIDGKKLEERLSVLEFKLLATLYSKADAVCTRDELCKELWGEGGYTYDMLHQLVHRLKRRIEPDPANARYIVAVPGVGYRLKSRAD